MLKLHRPSLEGVKAVVKERFDRVVGLMAAAGYPRPTDWDEFRAWEDRAWRAAPAEMGALADATERLRGAIAAETVREFSRAMAI